MGEGSRSINDELHGVLLLIGVIWSVFLVSFLTPGIDRYGLMPRTLGGLPGVLTMPFLHANFGHIVGNTIPLVVLLSLLSGSRARSWEIAGDIAILSGLLLWIFGRSGNHIGASGLVSGLTAFLILSGFLEGRIIPLLLSVLVAFLYGGTLVLGIVPSFGSRVSWDGHLCGAASGVIVAYALIRMP